MSNLANLVIAFTERAKVQPSAALDPRTIAVLERAAKDDSSSVYAASHAPIAQDTVEVHSQLLSAATESRSEEMRFERPVEIVGFLPTLVPFGAAGALTVATTDSLLVELRVDVKSNLTQGQGSMAGGTSSTLVTLSAISILAPRLFRMVLQGANPAIQMKFSWKLGAGVHRDTRISLAAFVRYLD